MSMDIYLTNLSQYVCARAVFDAGWWKDPLGLLHSTLSSLAWYGQPTASRT